MIGICIIEIKRGHFIKQRTLDSYEVLQLANLPVACLAFLNWGLGAAENTVIRSGRLFRVDRNAWVCWEVKPSLAAAGAEPGHGKRE